MTNERLMRIVALVALAAALIVAVVLIVGLVRPKPTTYAAGRTFYVALNGANGNAGTAAAPWRNLAYAVARLAPGDRLCIGGGVWTGSADVIDSQQNTVPSGTNFADGVITIGGCNGDVPTLKPLAGLSAIRLTTGAPHHLVFESLGFDGSLQRDPVCCQPGTSHIPDAPELIYTSNGAHHLRFARLVVEHTMSHAVQVSANNSPPTTPTAIELLDSVFRDIGNATGDSGHGGAGINNGYAIYASTAANIIRGNRFESTRGTALVVYGSDYVVADNVFAATGTRGGPAHAVNFGSSSHPVESVRNVFANNVVAENAAGGVQVYTRAAVDVVNNTFYKLGTFAVHAQYCQRAVVQNNIFRLNASDVRDDTAGVCVLLADHNLPSASDPRFVDADGGDFRIAIRDSPAVNTGVTLDGVATDADGTTRPQAGRFDLGAFEFPASATTIDDVVPGVRPAVAAALGAVVESITVGPASLASLVCHNPNADRAFVQLFDASTALRSGATAPVWTLGIAPNATLPLMAIDLDFAYAIRAAATTTPAGAVGPASPLVCSFGVR